MLPQAFEQITGDLVGYSMLDGACHLDALSARAKALGQPAIALTDHGNLHGAIHFYQACVDAGVKPIIGIEAYVAPGDRKSRKKTDGNDRGAHLLLLAANLTGYRNLLKLSTIGFTEGFYHNPRIDREILAAHSEGLIGTSACLSGEIATALRDSDGERARAIAEDYASILEPNRFFIELQSHIKEQAEVNPELIDLADRVGLGLVATNDVHFLDADDYASHDVLTCVGKSEKLSDESRFLYPQQLYLKSTNEMLAAAPDLGERWLESCANTNAIAEMCNLELKFATSHAPAVKIEYHAAAPSTEADAPADKQTPDPNIENLSILPLAESPTPEESRRCDTALRDVVMAGALLRYGDQINDAIRQRIDHELDVLADKQISAYFLMVWDAVRFARNHNIPCTARGSGVGSMVAYCLGLSNACPIRFGLLFERFTDPDRSEYPDLDIDICQDGRPQVIEYLRTKYQNVAQIITFGTLKAKAVIRDISRVMGVPKAKVDTVANLIPDLPGTTLATALKANNELRGLADKDPEVARILKLAGPLEGLPRHVSTHAAGIVIANRPLEEIVPLYSERGTGDLITQWDGPTVEKVGLLKMDFIGSKTLSVIQKSVQLVDQTLGVHVDLQSLAENDPAVWSLFQCADTDGIFQFESDGMRDLLVGMCPKSLEDLIAAVALYRPGPIDLIPSFLARKNGEEPVPQIHPVVDKHTQGTYGVMVYQEQVMLVMNALGGIPLRHAYTIIKAISKKKQSVIADARDNFVKGAVSNGLNNDLASKLFDQILDFAGYGFNKSHAAGYAIIAFQMAWLKAHCPVQFMAARLIYDADSAKTIAKRVEQCRHARLPDGSVGIPVLPPDVNVSGASFIIDYKDDAIHDVCHGRLRFGLGAVKGVGQAAVTAIIEAREVGGPFQDLMDFRSRVDKRKVHKGVVKSLINGGAFDSLHGPGQRASLLDYTDKGGKAAIELKPESSLIDVLRGELNALGMYVSGHPLDLHQDGIDTFTSASVETCLTMPPYKQVTTPGMVANIRKTKTKHGQNPGQEMAFFTLAGRSETIDVVLFPIAYAGYKDALETHRVVVVAGKIQHRDGKVNVIADRVYPIDDVEAHLTSSLTIVLPEQSDAIGDEQLRDLAAVLRDTPGDVPVSFHLPSDRGTLIARANGLRVNVDKNLLDRLNHALGNHGTVQLYGPGSSAA